eukprot:TRINITY_DN94109_c0_g1_i1.p1 TRINITY_DN94109_c0_g1~~TRINITY_DN94109_c0_g1_i1.p1  ORF type:complete len:108 (-),score=6.81 TRINITY_DN94109_c0_g1_i1:19-342(-)
MFTFDTCTQVQQAQPGFLTIWLHQWRRTRRDAGDVRIAHHCQWCSGDVRKRGAREMRAAGQAAVGRTVPLAAYGAARRATILFRAPELQLLQRKSCCDDQKRPERHP